MATKRFAFFLLGLAAAILPVGSSRASIYQFTGTGGSAGLTGTAEFTFDAVLDKITVKLTNTTATTLDAGDLFTGVEFNLGGLTPTLSSDLGIQRSVNAVGVFTDSATAMDLSWEVISKGSGDYQLDFNPDAKDAIIGPPTAGSYSGANSSIKDNNGHDPFAALTATFVLDVPGLLDTTPFTLKSFLFGTGPSAATGDITVPPPPNPQGGEVPELPSGLVWAGLAGVVGIGAQRRGLFA